MPSGLTHEKFHKAGWVIALPASLISIVVYSPETGIGFFFGYLLHRWFDNDLDLVSVSAAEGRMLKDFKILGWLLVGYSTVYGAAFRNHHRSFLSHFPFVSTLIRLVYFFWWVPLVVPKPIEFWMIEFAIAVWLGLSCADAGHFFADMFWTEDYFTNGKYSKSKNVLRNKRR